MSTEMFSARPLGGPTGPREDYKPAPEPFRRDTSIKPEKVEIIKHQGHNDKGLFLSFLNNQPVVRKRYVVSSLDEVFPPAPPLPKPTDESRLKAVMQGDRSLFEADKTSMGWENTMNQGKAVKAAVQGITIVDQVIDAVRSGCHTVVDIQRMTLLEKDKIQSAVSKLVRNKRLVDKRKTPRDPRYLEMPKVEKNISVKPLKEVSTENHSLSRNEPLMTEIVEDKLEKPVTDEKPVQNNSQEISSVNERFLRIQQLHNAAESAMGTFWESFNELVSLAKKGAEDSAQLDKLNALINKFKEI